MEIAVRRAYACIELIRKRLIEIACLDDLLHVGEITQPVRGAHAGGELELDESRQAEHAVAVNLFRNVLRNRERNCFRLAVAGKLTAHQHLDAHARFAVAEVALCTWMRRHVTSSHQALLKTPQTLRRD